MADHRETITKVAQARFAHKKQLNGHGEFALVLLRLEPLPRGAGFEFVNEAHEESVPSRFHESVERGVREAAKSGVHGFDVVDFRSVLVGGAYHDRDSTPEAFSLAAQGAFRAALLSAEPVILL